MVCLHQLEQHCSTHCSLPTHRAVHEHTTPDTPHFLSWECLGHTPHTLVARIAHQCVYPDVFASQYRYSFNSSEPTHLYKCLSATGSGCPSPASASASSQPSPPPIPPLFHIPPRTSLFAPVHASQSNKQRVSYSCLCCCQLLALGLSVSRLYGEWQASQGSGHESCTPSPPPLSCPPLHTLALQSLCQHTCTCTSVPLVVGVLA
jgi:hypothetical protein